MLDLCACPFLLAITPLCPPKSKHSTLKDTNSKPSSPSKVQSRIHSFLFILFRSKRDVYPSIESPIYVALLIPVNTDMFNDLTKRIIILTLDPLT